MVIIPPTLVLSTAVFETLMFFFDRFDYFAGSQAPKTVKALKIQAVIKPFPVVIFKNTVFVFYYS